MDFCLAPGLQFESRSAQPFQNNWNPAMNQPRSFLLITLLSVFASLTLGQQSTAQTRSEKEAGKHLFILSGQSNMGGHRPQEAFTPAVNKTFGKENVIVVQVAQGGQPMHRWYKQWKAPTAPQPAQATIGDIYDRLMKQVNKAVGETPIQSVTFIWMQGENDARREWGDIYADSLVGLHKQLSADLKRDDVNFVIGRLSDFDNDNKRYKHWTKVRDAQVATANGNPRFAWVNTDDLNDGTNRKGKTIKNDLHLSAEGYKTLGSRFAEKATGLIHKNQSK